MAPYTAPQFQPGLYLLLSTAVAVSSAFNIDVKFPIIKQGPPGSYFGYSVALHRQLKDQDRYLLLVGAPQAEGLPGQLANRTGALFYCTVSPTPNNCKRAKFEKPTDPQTESKEDQWLGVTVASQGPGGKVVVCAHRYEKRQLTQQDEKRILVGRCFILSDNIAINPDDDWDTSPAQFCENVGDDHQGLLMCQQGMAAGFTHPNHYAYYGAPGGWNWQGTVQVSQKNITFLDLNILSDGPYILKEAGKAHSYIGYSLTAGQRVTHPKQFSYVAGGPRHNHTGAVFVLRQSTDDELAIEHTIMGSQTGSYFGSSVAIADLDNDSWQDIIVGAPHYFDQKKEISGTVHIYMNEAGQFSEEPNLVLNGSKDSMFGYAISTIGDINQDGFQDIAIGAPYDGFGKVFIYHGSKDGLNPQPSQVISGADLEKTDPINTFGYSISGGLDVDRNDYPDVLIGTLSDRVILLRSRPVINISKNFTVHPSIIDPSTCTIKSCVTVTVCFSYIVSTGNRKYNRSIGLKYTLEVEKERRSSPRIKFVKTNSAIYHGILTMPQTKCQSVQLGLMDNVEDKLQPISVTLNYSIDNNSEARGRKAEMNNYPILNILQDHTGLEEIHIQKECGNDRICNSNLQLKHAFGRLGNNEVFHPIRRKRGKQILDFDPQSNPYSKKLVLQVNVTNFPTNATNGEDAHQARLNITLPDTLTYVGIRAESVRCDPADRYTVICELGNPFKKNQMATLNIILEVTGITLNTREIDVELQLQTESTQSDLNPVLASISVEIQLQVSLSVEKKIQQTYFSGTVIGESAIKTFEAIGSPADFTFQVTNHGEPLGDLGTLYLSFLWPYEISNGKWLLYLTEIEMNGTENQYCIPAGNIVNELNLTRNNHTTHPQRRKRELKPAAAKNLKIPGALKKGKGNLQLDCNQKHTARCKQFNCLLRNMTQKATVTLRARLWNSTFLEEYRDYDRIVVVVEASLHLMTNITTIKMKQPDVTTLLYVESQVDDEPPYEIPAWIIAVAVLAGVMLLSLIILLLWKCGFFKRTRYYRSMPKYHAVKIRKEERYFITEGFTKKKTQKKQNC
ncbi:integrin alpha-3b isoform X2 [Stegostoma tigrinum]|uniref:integrin alpha-3b isoform X2 n=1 Tax=Stegostoma tigrinum TaxID=3053191 RepID=UPI00202B9085|nr:integrin alpha-3b isoform X2 [Stegostoma tigrinum]